ncbi:MAG: hypothetical protein ACPGVL_08680 [Pseudoalteromonas spongiae]|uniref:Letm1 RBD domain-containing protein n=1 Tax=Pseudoalteromonas spongiae TaxID=298657 RepID=A0ABU8EZ19_9GAMM|nr:MULTISPECIES: hypothetical protein [Pseudoalteromonas]KPV97096.1 hypothetical protein AN214_01113 [Pseudoalteromonas sp. P1-9]MEC8328477.1 hypothetical protein [Pseudomonadota bacterium]
MRTMKYFHKAPVRVLKIKQQRSRLKVRRQMLQVKHALAQEKQETIDMLITYRNYTQGKANKAELKQANQQFLDVLKGVGLGIFAILPFAPITIPLIVKLGKLVGVEVLPSAFNKTDNK